MDYPSQRAYMGDSLSHLDDLLPFNVLTSNFLGFYVKTREISQADTAVSFCIFCILQFIILSEQSFLSFVVPFSQSNYSVRYIYFLVFRNRFGYRFVTPLGLPALLYRQVSTRRCELCCVSTLRTLLQPSFLKRVKNYLARPNDTWNSRG